VVVSSLAKRNDIEQALSVLAKLERVALFAKIDPSSELIVR
jgi:hypothetical protein